MPGISTVAAYGAGVLYVAVGLTNALLTPGFDLSRHSLSLLCLTSAGWVQSANLIGTGLLVVVAGWPRRGAVRWLLAAYGVALAASGLMVPDPMGGFPPGADPTATWHGIGHFAAGGLGFVCLAAAMAVTGVRRTKSLGRSVFSWVSAVVFLAGFFALAGTGGSTAGILAFWVGLLLSWVWLAWSSSLVLDNEPVAKASRAHQ